MLITFCIGRNNHVTQKNLFGNDDDSNDPQPNSRMQ